MPGRGSEPLCDPPEAPPGALPENGPVDCEGVEPTDGMDGFMLVCEGQFSCPVGMRVPVGGEFGHSAGHDAPKLEDGDDGAALG